MANRVSLIIDIKGFWHPGTGQGLGSHLDAVTHRGAGKLPALPGRTVKGLLRDAVNRWEQFGGFSNEPFSHGEISIVEHLFGPPPEWEPPETSGPAEPADQRRAGLLRCSDASLGQVDRDYLSVDSSLLAGLYRSHFSTAIEYESGTAKEKSLRGIEVIVPLILQAEISLLDGAAQPVELMNSWIEILRAALPLVRAVGAYRSRGLGRAVLSLKEVQ